VATSCAQTSQPRSRARPTTRPGSIDRQTAGASARTSPKRSVGVPSVPGGAAATCASTTGRPCPRAAPTAARRPGVARARSGTSSAICSTGTRVLARSPGTRATAAGSTAGTSTGGSRTPSARQRATCAMTVAASAPRVCSATIVRAFTSRNGRTSMPDPRVMTVSGSSHVPDDGVGFRGPLAVASALLAPASGAHEEVPTRRLRSPRRTARRPRPSRRGSGGRPAAPGRGRAIPRARRSPAWRAGGPGPA